MRNWTMAILPLALTMTATGCSGAGNEGKRQDGNPTAGTAGTADAGPVTTQNYSQTGFTAVEVAGPDDVTIRQGDAFSISAKGPKDILDRLEIKLDGTTLVIGRKREGFSFSSRDDDDVDIAITMPKLDGVRLTGSGSIDADTIDGDAVKAVLTGSGDLKAGKLTGKSAKLTLSGSGDIEVGSGTIGSGDVSITGSGDIDAGGLVADTLDISIAGSGSVDAQATGSADISILGSGDVKLTGGATCKTSQIGSGTATCS